MSKNIIIFIIFIINSLFIESFGSAGRYGLNDYFRHVTSEEKESDEIFLLGISMLILLSLIPLMAIALFLENIEQVFLYACENGYLVIAKLLYKLLYIIKPNINKNSGNFEKACIIAYQNKYFEMAKWLIEIKMEDIFIYSCKKGHLEVVEWLLEIRPNINDSPQNEIAFFYACVEGYLEVAKLLFQKNPKINIYANNNSTFIHVCQRGNLQIADWLYSIIRKSEYKEYSQLFKKNYPRSCLVRYNLNLFPIIYKSRN
jgi:hypothetical protein